MSIFRILVITYKAIYIPLGFCVHVPDSVNDKADALSQTI